MINKALSILMKALALALLLPVSRVYAIDVTGDWSGFSVANGSRFANEFTLDQNGTTITGAFYLNGVVAGIISGTITGDFLSYQTNFPSLNYSSNAQATTDGATLTGTFLDSQGTTGTFTAQKAIEERETLTPRTALEAPIVAAAGGTASLILEKFKIPAKNGEKLKVRYVATIIPVGDATAGFRTQASKPPAGAKQTITSKKSTVTFRNVPPGSYSGSYRAQAVSGGKVVFQTKPSASAGFRLP